MRKLKLQVQVSVDGYVADINGKTDWLVWNWGPHWDWDDALKEYFIDLTDTVDCVLLSRKMAVEGFIDHWAAVAADPKNEQAAFAKTITAAKKIVFSKTLERSVWKNTVIAAEELAIEINNLKNQPGDDIIAYGGAGFASELLQQSLVDELYLFVNPTALGIGLKIFVERTKLQLLQSTAFACGVTVLGFKALTADPSV